MTAYLRPVDAHGSLLDGLAVDRGGSPIMDDSISVGCVTLVDPNVQIGRKLCAELGFLGQVVAVPELDSAVDFFDRLGVEPAAFLVRGSLQSPFFREVVMVARDEFNGWPDVPLVFLEENPTESSSYEWGRYLGVEVCTRWQQYDIYSLLTRVVDRKYR